LSREPLCRSSRHAGVHALAQRQALAVAGLFPHRPDPERGYALAAIARDLDIPAVKPAQLRELISSRMDAELFGYSYDYVGDLAETIALAWPEKADSRPGRNDAPGLAEVVETLQASSRREGPGLVENWLDRLDPPGRYALLKLVTGGFRMGLSSRLIKQALAGFGKSRSTRSRSCGTG
jgi:DNA ligase-1